MKHLNDTEKYRKTKQLEKIKYYNKIKSTKPMKSFINMKMKPLKKVGVPMHINKMKMRPLKRVELTSNIRPLKKVVLNEVKYTPFEFKDKVLPIKLIGPTKHYPAAIKEWKNSVYAYNKNSIKAVTVKDDMVSNVIKQYFYLSNNTNLARSRRMRALIRKKTHKKIFVSNAEIKQTSDKAIVTVFTYNREKQNLLRKIFFDERRKGLLDYSRNFNAISIEPQINNHKNLLPVISKTKITRTSVTRSFKLMQNKTIRNLLAIKSFDLDDRKQKINKKLYLNLNRRRDTRLSLFKRRFKDFSNMKPRFNYFYLNKKKLNLYKTKRIKLFRKIRVFGGGESKLSKQVIPVSGIKLKNELRFINAKLSFKKYEPLVSKGKVIKLSEQTNKVLRKKFYYRYLKYIFSKFKIKVFTNKKEVSSIISKYKNRKIPKKLYLNKKAKKKRRLNKLAETIMPLAKLKQWHDRIYFIINGKIQFMSIKDLIKYTSYNQKLPAQKKLIISSIKNIKLTLYLTHILSKYGDVEKKLLILFNRYYKNKYLKYLAIKSRKEALLTGNFVKLMLNRYKYNKLLPGLKSVITDIYNKKTELNIVDLKYPHLNTDIFTQSIALKLRGKTSLSNVLKRSIHLAKVQRKFINYIGQEELLAQYDLNKISHLTKYFSTKLNNLEKKGEDFNVNDLSKEDYLSNVLEKIYPRSFSWLKQSENMNNNNDNKQIVALTNANLYDLAKKKKYIKKAKSKLHNILAKVKYRWVTGVKLQVAGRITKRYTAARSVFKYKYKGSLQNKDFSKKIEYIKKSMPTVRLRHQIKANSQYSFVSSKRRIGAYGIKGWISGF